MVPVLGFGAARATTVESLILLLLRVEAIDKYLMIILETDVLVGHHHDALPAEQVLLAWLLLRRLPCTSRIY